MRYAIVISLCGLSSCAICNRHPKTCNAVVIGVGVAVIGGLSARDLNRCSVIGKYTQDPYHCAGR